MNTQHERILRHHLWKLGLRYRKNVRTLPGNPDLVFATAMVAVFCDGDFWHGRYWSRLKRKLADGWNANYWVTKIAANRARDHRVNKQLRQLGWYVVRFWESDIIANPTSAAANVDSIVRSRA